MRNPPCPGRGDNHTEQQDPGFVHRALKRHCFAGNGDSTLERFFVQSGIGSFEKARHCRTPLKTEHSADIEIELAISNSRSSHRTALVSSAQRTRYRAEHTESRVPCGHLARTDYRNVSIQRPKTALIRRNLASSKKRLDKFRSILLFL